MVKIDNCSSTFLSETHRNRINVKPGGFIHTCYVNFFRNARGRPSEFSYPTRLAREQCKLQSHPPQGYYQTLSDILLQTDLRNIKPIHSQNTLETRSASLLPVIPRSRKREVLNHSISRPVYGYGSPRVFHGRVFRHRVVSSHDSSLPSLDSKRLV